MLRGGGKHDQGHQTRTTATSRWGDRKCVLPALLAAVFAGCGRAAPKPAPPSAPSPLLSHASPDFRRPALDGSTIETTAWRGRVIVVDFFSEHCVPCARSLPSIEALHRAMPDVAVLGVSEDDDVAGARRMIQRHALSFPVVHDDGHALAGRFRVSELPATFVVDGRGVIRWRGTAETEDDVRAVVESAR
jgi:cytochrome c biogenesis protein CcmG/thiol:disulfide interchange protein DsbE